MSDKHVSNKWISKVSLSTGISSLLSSFYSFLWTGVPHKVVVSNEIRHIKTLNEVKKLLWVSPSLSSSKIFPHLTLTFLLLNCLVSRGIFQLEILFLFFCAVDTWQCLVHSLIQGVTTIYHQATGLVIIPASTFSERIVLDIWGRGEKWIKITELLNHRMLALEDLWKIL